MAVDEQPQFTIEELGARFGAQLSQAYAQIITLEKELANEMKIVQALGLNETKLIDHIHGIEAQLAEMKMAKFAEGQAQITSEAKSIVDGS